MAIGTYQFKEHALHWFHVPGTQFTGHPVLSEQFVELIKMGQIWPPFATSVTIVRVWVILPEPQEVEQEDQVDHAETTQSVGETP